MMIFIVLIILIIGVVVFCSKEEQQQKEWEEKVAAEKDRKEKNVTAEHEKSIRENQRKYGERIPATGDYRNIDSLYSSNDDRHRYIWCKHHLEGKVCVHCIYRKESSYGTSFMYGPNDRSHCAEYYNQDYADLMTRGY